VLETPALVGVTERDPNRGADARLEHADVDATRKNAALDAEQVRSRHDSRHAHGPLGSKAEFGDLQLEVEPTVLPESPGRGQLPGQLVVQSLPSPVHLQPLDLIGRNDRAAGDPDGPDGGGGDGVGNLAGRHDDRWNARQVSRGAAGHQRQGGHEPRGTATGARRPALRRAGQAGQRGAV
jgi:hypothetical protein